MKPMLPATGSTITAARSSFASSKVFINASVSLYGIEIVNLARSSGIPGESGKPKVDTPEPALTSNESTCPW